MRAGALGAAIAEIGIDIRGGSSYIRITTKRVDLLTRCAYGALGCLLLLAQITGDFYVHRIFRRIRGAKRLEQ